MGTDVKNQYCHSTCQFLAFGRKKRKVDLTLGKSCVSWKRTVLIYLLLQHKHLAVVSHPPLFQHSLPGYRPRLHLSVYLHVPQDLPVCLRWLFHRFLAWIDRNYFQEERAVLFVWTNYYAQSCGVVMFPAGQSAVATYVVRVGYDTGKKSPKSRCMFVLKQAHTSTAHTPWQDARRLSTKRRHN